MKKLISGTMEVPMNIEKDFIVAATIFILSIVAIIYTAVTVTAIL